ncbi:dipeptide ABC transporter ATP-binding protein [Schumannella soli]|uniref:ABC transporter ATP-binding protein n=1 Tax=Schumannella soli TaxID=2590779 RepID=A0A506Y132_9MICO|nr:ABC transporter ATP-binding protein [Schumannella soli]TPW75715.1 ABC transporter ATP-binding protein [Schumannella soli]
MSATTQQDLAGISTGSEASADVADTASAPLLEVDRLAVHYRGRDGGVIEAVREVSLSIAPGETLAVVGESGSGKSTTAQAIVQLLAPGARIAAGSLRFRGEDLATASRRRLRQLRGVGIGFVPQDPTVSLDPVKRIGAQVAETLLIHGLADRRSAPARAVESLGRAGLPDPELQATRYPHELSGGMRQRVLIAIAIAAEPPLIVADEPTSALDVTVQRQILDQLDRLRAAGTALLLITHDLGVAADRADRILVLSEGRVVEEGSPAQILGSPRHEYTRRLIAAAPSIAAQRGSGLERHRLPVATLAALTTGGVGDPFVERTGARASERPGEPRHEGAPGADAAAGFDEILRLEGVTKAFPLPRSLGGGEQLAVDDVTLAVPRAGTLAIVGESGSGKSTTARIALRLEPADAGRVLLDGVDVSAARGGELRRLRRRVQLVHQNPYAALNPRWSVETIVTDPLAAHGLGTRRQRRDRAAALLDAVALPSRALTRRAAELSGGQRQRVAIARALALGPELLVLDEPVSALDVSIQAQVLALLADLQAELGVSYLFISHDLAVVRQIADTVAVLQRGRLVEQGDVDTVFSSPVADYTRELLAAIPGTRFAGPADGSSRSGTGPSGTGPSGTSPSHATPPDAIPASDTPGASR